ncbi:MAG TPA: type II toxin-antitoxin system RelE/ParE family toxin [Burkholderiales bacterium]|nr:type II toxin-antitoxin system RelE/ParE family toxin [Burkholderiales bacterium]
MSYRIVVTPLARDMLAAISDRRVKQTIAKRIDALADEPEQQGKPLVGPLKGYRCVRAAGQRYRIIYEVRMSEAMVVVLTVGIRKEGSKQDIYSLAQKLFRSGLLQAPAQGRTKRRK